jgi:polysaccharide deacetylase 2 family uncharacterized protein YibQ
LAAPSRMAKAIRGKRGKKRRVSAPLYWLASVLAVVAAGVWTINGWPRIASFIAPRASLVSPSATAEVSGNLSHRSLQTATASTRLPRSLVTGSKIAIVIDDVGNDVAAARRAIALPKAITLSFLPYPDTTPTLAREAARAGHEILVHVPMEPEGNADAGPMALRIALSPDEIARRLAWDFARVPGFAGINNHMGSRFTANRDALIPVMQAVAVRGVFFLDSRTTPNSQVVALAKSLGVPTAKRDVFLDDETTAASVVAALRLVETRARQQGTAIAIGHPHPETLIALETWTHEASVGSMLVPAGEIVRLRSRQTDLRAAISQ